MTLRSRPFRASRALNVLLRAGRPSVLGFPISRCRSRSWSALTPLAIRFLAASSQWPLSRGKLLPLPLLPLPPLLLPLPLLLLPLLPLPMLLLCLC